MEFEDAQIRINAYFIRKQKIDENWWEQNNFSFPNVLILITFGEFLARMLWLENIGHLL